MPSKAPYALKIVAKSTLAKARAKQKVHPFLVLVHHQPTFLLTNRPTLLFVLLLQLQSEIKIHRTLRHVNVVRFERYFEDNTNVYMLLELCTNNVRLQLTSSLAE